MSVDCRCEHWYENLLEQSASLTFYFLIAALRKLAWAGVPADLRPMAWQLLLVSAVAPRPFCKVIRFKGLFATADVAPLIDAGKKTNRVSRSCSCYVRTRKRGA